jgi:hypothetical protein
MSKTEIFGFPSKKDRSQFIKDAGKGLSSDYATSYDPTEKKNKFLIAVRGK